MKYENGRSTDYKSTNSEWGRRETSDNSNVDSSVFVGTTLVCRSGVETIPSHVVTIPLMILSQRLLKVTYDVLRVFESHG